MKTLTRLFSLFSVYLISFSATASGDAVFTGPHRLPDLNQMHPMYGQLLKDGWPMCGPVQGANLAAWLMDRGFVKSVSKAALTYQDLLPVVKEMMGPSMMNTRGGIGTEGPDFLKGLEKWLAQNKVKYQTAIGGAAFGAKDIAQTVFAKPAEENTVYFVMLGFYHSREGSVYRRQKGHFLMFFPKAGRPMEFYATDTSLESSGSPKEEEVRMTEVLGMKFHKRVRFFQPPYGLKVYEVAGVKTPEKLQIEKVFVEGVVRFDFKK